MTMVQSGIGLSNDLIVVGGKSNAFTSYNILKNQYRRVGYVSVDEICEGI